MRVVGDLTVHPNKRRNMGAAPGEGTPGAAGSVGRARQGGRMGLDLDLDLDDVGVLPNTPGGGGGAGLIMDEVRCWVGGRGGLCV